mgnify:CR=1 FL=1
MHVTHIERENEFNVIIFQCGWYRGIIVYLALKEQSCSFRALFILQEAALQNMNPVNMVLHYSVPHRVIPKKGKKRSVQTYGIHDRSKQKRHSRNQ